MASWKKHFKPANVSPLTRAKDRNAASMSFSNYRSTLPEVYSGHPNRVERYVQYDAMDMDSEVNASLDILAEFCTQTSDETNMAFNVHFHEDPSKTETTIIYDHLRKWYKLQEFERRLFKIFRNVLKYGDQIFIREPDTMRWFFVDPATVEKIIVDESAGREIEQYIISDIRLNLENLTATQKPNANVTSAPGLASRTGGNPEAYNTGTMARYSVNADQQAVPAEHVVHLSLTEEMDNVWPFGVSILESIFKVYKQKELLEDAIIIYRVQRAPERRIFKIDVGNMSGPMAMAYVERIKNEMHQRRIPSISGGAQSVDTTYNPQSITEDFFFPHTADGRGSTVDTLSGGENLGEIDDLKFFSNKLFRALRIPSSYLPTGPNEAESRINDGKVGTALIQEYRFNEYCKRLQVALEAIFDNDFKLFLKSRGIEIDNSLFDIKFNEPQNFAYYRKAELDQTRISAFTQIEGLPYMSKQFMLKRFLGLTEEELEENSILWAKEQGNDPTVDEAEGSALRSVGVSPGGFEGDMELSDMGDLDSELDIDMEDASDEIEADEEGGAAPDTDEEISI